MEDWSDIDEDDNYYLIDYGLVERYTFQGSHKPYEPDKRKANNGTCEFRSRDAHIGVISRRSDIESLGYNLILWFYGRHPWANILKDAEKVLAKKNWAMSNIDDFLKESFSGKTFVNDEESNDSKASKTPSSKSKSNAKKTSAVAAVQQQQAKNNIPISTVVPKGFKNFFDEINQLSHDDRPNYERYKNILQDIARLNPKTGNNNLSNDSPKRSRAARSNNKQEGPKKSNNKTTSNKSKILYTNDNSECPSNTESDDTEIEDEVIDTRITSSRTTRTQTTKANQKLSPTKRTIKKQLKNKKVLPESPQTPKSVMNPRRNLRNRRNNIFDISHDDDELDSINETKKSPTNCNGMNTRNLTRYSTPLISFTPFDGDDPLFGPFEPEESLNYVTNNDNKKNQTLRSTPIINGKIKLGSKNMNSMNSIVNDENETDNTNNNNTNRRVNQCRIYINNQRCRSRKSYDDDDWNQAYQIVPDKHNTSNDNGPIMKITNGKSSKSTITMTSTTTTTTTTASSKPNNCSAKRNVQKSNNVSSKFVTPNTDSGVTETAAMQRIRLMLQNKKKK